MNIKTLNKIAMTMAVAIAATACSGGDKAKEEKKAADGFDALYKNRDANFGNGRDVRNRFEDMVTAQSNRVAALEKPGKDDLMAVKPEDIEI